MNFLPVIMTAISMKEGNVRRTNWRRQLKEEYEEDNQDKEIKEQIKKTYDRLLNELDTRNFITQVRKEIEEDQMPINRLKMYIDYTNTKASLNILNNEWLSTDELSEALAYLEVIERAKPRTTLENIVIREAIHQKLNSNEYILK